MFPLGIRCIILYRKGRDSLNQTELKQRLNGGYQKTLLRLYGPEQLERQTRRYLSAVDTYVSLFGDKENLVLFSAPGRTEIGGNHTDHQSGRVLAASIDLDVIAVVSPDNSGVIHIKSEGHDENFVQLDRLEPAEGERNTSTALVRGIAARFAELGYKIGGFTAYTTSNVLAGSGLSSSAAYEVLVGTILSGLYNGGGVDPVVIAQIGQYAENNYFGKPCGLMDQAASSVGGLVMIDFKDQSHPLVERIPYDFTGQGYALCVVNTGGSHADLTDEYAAIPVEMRSVAGYFGKEVLREVEAGALLKHAVELRKLPGGDRAFLRALHFEEENERVLKQAAALKENDFAKFLELVRESGCSSYYWLQNVVSVKSTAEQGVALGLALSERLLKGRGICRVHGGGFAGTLQAYVPLKDVESYRRGMERVFGEGSCYVLRIRPCGGARID